MERAGTAPGLAGGVRRRAARGAPAALAAPIAGATLALVLVVWLHALGGAAPRAALIARSYATVATLRGGALPAGDRAAAGDASAGDRAAVGDASAGDRAAAGGASAAPPEEASAPPRDDGDGEDGARYVWANPFEDRSYVNRTFEIAEDAATLVSMVGAE